MKNQLRAVAMIESNCLVQESPPTPDDKKYFPKILSNSLWAAVVGGVLTFVFLTGSPEKALKFGSHSTSSLAGGIGILGFFGTIIWNILISALGLLVSGLTVAIGSLIFYSWNVGLNEYAPVRPPRDNRLECAVVAGENSFATCADILL